MLGYRMRNQKNLIIGRVDLVQNDIPGIKLTSVPLVAFYPANSNQPEYFTRPINLKNLLNFLKEKIPEIQNEDL
mgnify:FL=1